MTPNIAVITFCDRIIYEMSDILNSANIFSSFSFSYFIFYAFSILLYHFVICPGYPGYNLYLRADYR
jgi:hypothetical protein